VCPWASTGVNPALAICNGNVDLPVSKVYPAGLITLKNASEVRGDGKKAAFDAAASTASLFVHPKCRKE